MDILKDLHPTQLQEMIDIIYKEDLQRRKLATIQVWSGNIDVVTRGLFHFHLFVLPKPYKVHISVEYCNTIDSVKYICMYVNKGSDIDVLGLQSESRDRNMIIYIEEIAQYISNHEDVWWIISFLIHEGNPAVFHLEAHLGNGQCVYFTAANAQQIIMKPTATTLTAFITLCQNETFVNILWYSEVHMYYTCIFNGTTIRKLYTVHPNQDGYIILPML